MTPTTFRSDPYLRTTGYNFYVWAGVNLLVTVPLFASLAGRPWPALLGLVYPLALGAAGVVGMALNDNRVRKMYGDPAPLPLVEAGRIWLPVLLLALILTVLFVARGPAAYVQPLWMLMVGTGYLQWGAFTLREFRWFGMGLIVAGAVTGLAIRPSDLPPGLPSGLALRVWVVAMGVLWLPFGAYLNARYLHALGSDAVAGAPSRADE